MTNSAKKLCSAVSALTLTFSTTAYAHPHSEMAVVAEAGEVKASAGPALWKVADEDTTIYLFGTIHFLPENVDWYKGAIPAALETSDILITEIHVQPGTEAATGQKFQASGLLPEGGNLRELLNPDQKAAYEAAMGSIGFPAESFDGMKPWFAAFNLSLLPLIQAGYSPETGVEKVLETKVPNKPRGQLESVDMQIGMLDGLPAESQRNYLLEVSQQVDKLVPMVDLILAEWLVGDTEGLDKLMNVEQKDQVLADRMFINRNKNWADWIDTRLDTPGTVFVAVGAAHLAGDESVQAALETRGIASKRVQ